MPPGIKGFQRGHPAHVSRHAKALASEVRAKVPADLMVDWHLAIIMWKDPQVVEGEDGLEVVWQESGGVIPDTARRDASLAWLANRGHGQAAQLIAIEQTLRLDVTGTGALQLGSLAPAVLLGVRDLLRLNSSAGDAPDGAPPEIQLQEDAIDAEFSEAPGPGNASASHDANGDASRSRDGDERTSGDASDDDTDDET